MEEKYITMQQFTFILALLFTYTNSTYAQNLVPNPSFEKINKVPLKWMGNNSEFDEHIQHWTSPTAGSPDIFFSKTINRLATARKGIDLTPHKAKTGNMMVGIKTYGCHTDGPHCKEDLQVKLKHPIVQGEEYYIEFWVNPVETSIFTNNIGLAFSDVKIAKFENAILYDLYPDVNETNVVVSKPNHWYRISGTITADANYDYALIGNFYDDDVTDIQETDKSIKYSYYLIDDVVIRPLNSNMDLATVSLEVGTQFQLDNIYFESGKATLLHKSFKELDKLYNALNNAPEVVIQINGHTDNQGSQEDNLILSEARAKAVADYLIKKGINQENIKTQGHGETLPIALNDTNEGRQLNRRVECLVLEQ